MSNQTEQHSLADEFSVDLAVLVAVDSYEDGIPSLKTPVRDATALGRLLHRRYGYQVRTLFGRQAAAPALRRLLRDELPRRLDADSRLIFYFAGHGTKENGRTAAEVPKGYLLLQDAKRGAESSFLSMAELYGGLAELPCRHLLVFLDCCFAGLFQRSSRDLEAPQLTLYEEQFRYFVRHRAWQVIASAAHDQEALDLSLGLGMRGRREQHSPFAATLLTGLEGDADQYPPPDGDGVVTVSELFAYLTSLLQARQTPGTWRLPGDGGGEFVFRPRSTPLRLRRATDELVLDQKTNPYRGLKAYGRKDADLFFGREEEVRQLEKKVRENALTIVVGPSGCGKSSLVQAGLVPRLEYSDEGRFKILAPLRPAGGWRNAILRSLSVPGDRQEADDSNGASVLVERVNSWLASRRERHLVIVFDPFEEAFGLGRLSSGDRVLLNFLSQVRGSVRLHFVLVLRSDFEPLLAESLLAPGRDEVLFRVTGLLTQDQLRAMIEKPAAARVLFFRSESAASESENRGDLVEKLINEVIQMPGALPLLSFALHAMYLSYVESGRFDRELTWAEYDRIGSVVDSLRCRAEREYQDLDGGCCGGGDDGGDSSGQSKENEQATLRRVLLRMVELRGRESTRRRVPMWELDYRDQAENRRVHIVIERLTVARLIVRDSDSQGEHVELAHEALISAWGRLRRWLDHAAVRLPLRRAVTRASRDWNRSARDAGLLWDTDCRLGQLEGDLATDPFWFNRPEAEFLACSIEKRRRDQQRRTTSVLAITLVIGVVSTLLVLRHLEARRQTAFSMVRSFAGRAIELQRAVRQDEVSAQLARTAFLLDQQHGGKLRAEADFALRTVLGQPYFNYVLHDGKSIESLQFSPDSRYLITGGRGDYNVDAGKQPLKVWDLHNPGQAPIELKGRGVVLDLVVAPEGSTVYAAGIEGLQRWRLDDLETAPVTIRLSEWPLFSLAISPDGRALAAGDDNGKIFLWDLRQSLLQVAPRVLEGHKKTVHSLAFSPDGNSIASGSDDRRVLLWQVGSGEVRSAERFVHGGAVMTVHFSPDGRFLASGDRDGALRVEELEGHLEFVVPGSGAEDSLHALVFSPDGELLADGGSDQPIRIWRVADLEAGGRDPALELVGHERPVVSLAFSPDGRLLASGSRDHEVWVWQREPPNVVAEAFPEQESEVTALAMCPQGDLIASGSWAGTLKLWNLHEPDFSGQLLGRHQDYVRAIVWRNDCKLLISGAVDRTIRLWNPVRPGQAPLAVIRDDGDSCQAVMALALSPDGRTLAAGCAQRLIRLWDVSAPEAPRLVFERVGHTDQVSEDQIRAVAFHPQGRLLASAGGEGVVRLWSLEDLGREPRNLWPGRSPEGPRATRAHRIDSLAFSPDGRMLVSGSFDGTMRLWREFDRPPEQLVGHLGRVRSLAFTVDSKSLISAGEDTTCRIWNLDRLKDRHVLLREHANTVSTAIADPDSRYVISAGHDRRIVRSVLPTERLAEVACERVRRDPTGPKWEQLVGIWDTALDETLCSQEQVETRR